MEEYSENHHDYEFEIQGQLGPHWARIFCDMKLSTRADGRTILSGKALDQSALFGVLLRIRDLGTPLISVLRCDPQEGGKQRHPLEGENNVYI